MEIKTTINKTLSPKELTLVHLREIGKTIWILFIILILTFAVTIYFQSKISSYIAAIIIVMLFKYFYKRQDYRKTQIIGNFILNNDHLTFIIENITDTFDIEKITNLKIFYAGYDGMTVGRYVDNGDFNKITFDCNGIQYLYQFDLNSKDRIDDLKVIFQDWYDRRINFKEFFKGQRSFLFEVNFTYSEVQVLKERYKIDWI